VEKERFASLFGGKDSAKLWAVTVDTARLARFEGPSDKLEDGAKDLSELGFVER